MRTIRSMYHNNIDHRLRTTQAEVLAALGYPLVQDDATGVAHGQWLTETLAKLGPDEVILFLDIDCIPLEREIVEQALQAAEAGHVFGAAQAANHLDPNFIYAAPMFLAVSRRTWERLARPSLVVDSDFDSGGRLTAAARAAGVAVDLVWPSFTLHPRWLLGNRGCYGIGTFYDGRVFHLFRSRKADGHVAAFVEVGRSVVDGRPIDYLGLYRRSHSLSVKLANLLGPPARELRRFRRRFFRPRDVSIP
jgi:hypothetical protein